MKNTDWKSIAELIGIAAIVASLIFVGLQMRQSQEIAVASQYHDRTVLAVEWFHEQRENGNFEFHTRACFPELPPNVTLEQAARGCLSLQSFMTISDNHLYQYQNSGTAR